MTELMIEQRLHERLNCDLELQITTLSAFEEASYTVDAVDLSLSGVGISAETLSLSEGEEVLVRASGQHALRAEVKWATDDRAGLEFQESPGDVGQSWVGDYLSLNSDPSLEEDR